MNKIYKCFIAAIIILTIGIAIMVFTGCAKIEPKIDSIKPSIQSPEQSSEQQVTAGGNVNQVNFSLAGGGAVAAIMVVAIGVLGWKYFQSNKALHAVTSAVECLGHSAKSTVRFEAVAIGAEPYLRSKVKKWYKPKNNKTM